MSFNSLILPAIAAIIVFLCYMVTVQLMSKKKGSVSERLQRLSGERPHMESLQAVEAIVDPLHIDQQHTPLAITCEQILRVLGIDTEAFRKKSQLRFYRAGVTSADAPIYYLFFRFIGGPICVAFAVYYVFFIPAEGTTFLLHGIVGVIMGALGVFGGNIYLDNARQKRQKVLQNSFPDALDLLLVCVDSGLALDGALARVCKELWRARPAIAQELNRTRVELTLLNDRSQALTNLAERTDMMPFRSLVTTLLQSERFGTSLTETLRVLSDDYRNMRIILAEEKAGRLPILITIPLVTMLLPALFLMILGPGILTVMKTLHNM